MVTSVIFLIKFNLNRYIKHENMDYFQIMLVIVTFENFKKYSSHSLKHIFQVFFNTDIVEILLKLGYIHEK